MSGGRGPAAESKAAFETFAGRLHGAMVVVTTCELGVRAGCLVGFHSQSSIDPPRYCVWLSKANHTYRVALRAPRLAVHALTSADAALAEHFGTLSGEDVDKFTGHAVTERDGLPLLDALPHRLIGTRLAMLDLGGDHVCVELGVDVVCDPGPFAPLRLDAVAHLRPGHGAAERTVPVGPRPA